MDGRVEVWAEHRGPVLPGGSDCGGFRISLGATLWRSGPSRGRLADVPEPRDRELRRVVPAFNGTRAICALRQTSLVRSVHTSEDPSLRGGLQELNGEPMRQPRSKGLRLDPKRLEAPYGQLKASA